MLSSTQRDVGGELRSWTIVSSLELVSMSCDPHCGHDTRSYWADSGFVWCQWCSVPIAGLCGVGDVLDFLSTGRTAG